MSQLILTLLTRRPQPLESQSCVYEFWPVRTNQKSPVVLPSKLRACRLPAVSTICPHAADWVSRAQGHERVYASSRYQQLAICLGVGCAPTLPLSLELAGTARHRNPGESGESCS